MDPTRPLGRRAYGSIPHLPGSRTGPSDRHLSPAQAARLTQACGAGEEVLVQEKLDGSCVAVARVGDELFALGREGRLAADSRNESRRRWAVWVQQHQNRFLGVLQPGQRLVGEWLAMAHGTRYRLPHEPFVAFDLFTQDNERVGLDALVEGVGAGGFRTPHLIHRGAALSCADALSGLGEGGHGAQDPPEGAVWRLEAKRGGRRRVLAIAKFVRAAKVDGSYLSENTGRPTVWNDHPEADK